MVVITKPRKQTYTMDMYLNKNKDKDIRNDAYVQRTYIWTSEQANELIYTVLTNDYIPPIIIGEELNSQCWIIDGGQRTATCLNFRFGNKKITSSIENSIIRYMSKKKDENGKFEIDGNGNIVWEEIEYDIKNKTYNDLPDELKKRFNEYQIETVIHEGCDMKRISQLIKRYNNHTAMNVPQKAFTYIDNYAKDVRDILENDFFKNCGGYTDKEKAKGVMEKVVLETVMCISHLGNWKKQTKHIAAYLNKNATKEEFDRLGGYLNRLNDVSGEQFKDIFTAKNSFIWFTLFDKFNALNVNDKKFADFLNAFKNGLKSKTVNGVTFEELDEKKNTKDKALIIEKINHLEFIMNEFLEEESKNLENETMTLAKTYVNSECTTDDVELYEDILNDLAVEVDNESELLDECNKPSLISVIGHACEEEKDEVLPVWFVKFFKENDTYLKDQKENYLHMRNDFENFCKSRKDDVKCLY